MRLDERPVYLTGFMGSGKSEVGRRLAAGLGWAFEDTDDRVATAAGRSIEQIFRESGESRFRELEWSALRKIAIRPRLAVSTGGGLFLGAAQRARMKGTGTTVWLDAPLDVIRSRLGAGAGRPLWSASDPIGQRETFERRRAAYALADVRVEVIDESPEEVATRLLDRLNAIYR
jgi:shikimate kinase